MKAVHTTQAPREACLSPDAHAETLNHDRAFRGVLICRIPCALLVDGQPLRRSWLASRDV